MALGTSGQEGSRSKGSWDGNFPGSKHPAHVLAGASHLDRLQLLQEAEDKLRPVFHGGNVQVLEKTVP